MVENKYWKHLVKKPAREAMAPGISKVEGREYPTLTYMSNNLVPGCNVYLEGGWIWAMPDPNPHILQHTHNYDEVVLHIGPDHENPEELGAEIEYVLGGEPLIIDKTSAVFIPRGVKHGPLTWKRVDRPHIQMSIMLGAGTLAEAAPGGWGRK
jgi:hypothetical protein